MPAERVAPTTPELRSRCYISAPSGADVQKLVDAARRNGWNVVRSTSLENWATKRADATLRALSEVDLVIVALPPEGPRENALLELGFAVGAGKRVLALTPEGVALPSAADGIFYVKAGPDDVDALDFALAHLRPRQRPEQREVGPRNRMNPLGDAAVPLLERASTVQHGLRETLGKRPKSKAKRAERQQWLVDRRKAFEEVVDDALLAAGVDFVIGGSNPMRRDLAVWVDELEAVLGNPFLIELKSTPTRKIVDRVVRQLQSAGVRSIVIVHLFGSPARRLEAPTGQLLFIRLDELLRRMRNQPFSDVMRDVAESK